MRIIKRYQAKIGTHGVHRIQDKVKHKDYTFLALDARDVETLVRLLNDLADD